MRKSAEKPTDAVALPALRSAQRGAAHSVTRGYSAQRGTVRGALRRAAALPRHSEILLSFL